MIRNLRDPMLAIWLAYCAYAQQEPAPPVGTSPVQPLPFSHRAHAGVGLKCLECHKMSGRGMAAELPAASLCMNCHQVVKKDSSAIATLAAYAQEKRFVPWVRLYRLPDFANFSHRRHYVKAKIACEQCHGAIAGQDILRKEKSIAMTSCMACHDIMKASNNCDTCHVPHPS